MSHTLTIDDKRISSEDLKAVDEAPPKMNDWWADFGLGDRSKAWPSPPLEKCVETSGLFFLRQVNEDLAKRPKPSMYADATKMSDVVMLPPGVLPSEAAMAAPRRNVWALPGALGAIVVVALLSALGALWYSGSIVRPGSKAPTAASGFIPGPPKASLAILPPATEPSVTKPSAAQPSIPTKAPKTAPGTELVVVASSTPAEELAVTPAGDERREVKRKRSKRSKRKKRSRRSKDRDADEEKPVVTAPGYSLYATLGAASAKTAPTKSKGVVTEAVTSKGSMAPAGDTYRMLKVAASGESAKPAATASLPARIPASAISRGASRARSGVQACLRRFGFGRAAIRLRLTVSGASGRVSSARVQGRFKGTPAGSCALRRVRSLRFPRFSGSSQTILIPVRTY